MNLIPLDPTAQAFAVLHAVVLPINDPELGTLIAVTSYRPDHFELRAHIADVDYPGVAVHEHEGRNIAAVRVEAETLLDAVERLTMIARQIANVKANERVA